MTTNNATCTDCGWAVAPGEVVVVSGDALSPPCAWEKASETLSVLVAPGWTAIDVDADRREYEEAADVMRTLLAVVQGRLA